MHQLDEQQGIINWVERVVQRQPLRHPPATEAPGVPKSAYVCTQAGRGHLRGQTMQAGSLQPLAIFLRLAALPGQALV
jgi:hypothetical protein